VTDDGSVLINIDGPIATVMLNRPSAANSRNQDMRDGLLDIWHQLSKDNSVAVVILTGAGDRHFCAGMDLKESATPESPADRWDRLKRNRDVELLGVLPQATIAAVNGYAMGGGLEMALACDFRIMADQAVIGLPEVTAGLVPAAGGTQRLPRLVGHARAAELVLTGRRLSASEAFEWGLATRVVPLDRLQSDAGEFAATLAKLSPRALRYAKQLLIRARDASLADGLDAEVSAISTLLAERQSENADR
jgi:enoyl-CoA hydratase